MIRLICFFKREQLASRRIFGTEQLIESLYIHHVTHILHVQAK
jgi:hypothetical protein